MFYKKFIKSILLFWLLGFSSISFFNYKYDPANIFNDELVSKAVDIMIGGQNVQGLSNYNERRLKKNFIVEDLKSIETVVFGSSRTMSISSNDDSLRNYSVSGAVLEDILGLWIVCHENKEYKNVIIGIDAWIFNKNSGETRWEFLNDDYIRAVNKLGSCGSVNYKLNLEKYWQLFSIDYLEASIEKSKKDEKVYSIEGVSDSNSDKILLLKDGSINYGYEVNNISDKAVDEKVRKYLTGKVYHLEEFTRLDDFKIIEFQNLLRELTNKGKKVILLLTPYHPKVYKYLTNNEKYRMIIETERLVKSFMYKYDINVLGSFDPQKCGLYETDFLDGMHIKNSSMKKLFVVEKYI